MQPENIRVSLRPRGGWEPVDLGVRMAREGWRPLFGAWLATVVPMAVLLNLLLWNSLSLAAFITWWLKPAYDRVALHVLSEALFGRVSSVGDTLRTLPSLLRTGLFGSLTVFRLSPMRSVVLPVLQLEGLRGRARRDRTRLLVGRDFNVGFGLIVACLLFELLVVALGAVALIWILLPEALAPTLSDLVSGWLAGGAWWMLLGNAVLVMAMTAIEPFYVAAGFSVYINRRVYLEGWDIDLEFRKLARRAAGRARSGAPVAAGAVVLALLAAPVVRASDCSDRPEAARACIEEVMASPEFATVRSVEIWVPRSASDTEISSQSAGGLSALAEFLAYLFQLGLWTAAAVAVILLVRRLMRPAPAGDRAPGPLPAPGEIARRPRRGPEPLPAEPVAEARARFAEGDAVGALSLLYRAALTYLGDTRDVGLPASATEGECERIVRARVEEDLARDFSALALEWQRCAYAGRRTEPAVFQTICERWRPRFGAAA
ncbi:MAG: hypothetical protein V3V67_18115 [Myxococcota bacterium]